MNIDDTGTTRTKDDTVLMIAGMKGVANASWRSFRRDTPIPRQATVFFRRAPKKLGTEGILNDRRLGTMWVNLGRKAYPSVALSFKSEQRSTAVPTGILRIGRLSTSHRQGDNWLAKGFGVVLANPKVPTALTGFELTLRFCKFTTRFSFGVRH
jgi:hypothetical protein